MSYILRHLRVRPCCQPSVLLVSEDVISTRNRPAESPWIWEGILSSVRNVSLFISSTPSISFTRIYLPSHCATHQIRVILISAVVITSLLFPAIALYSSSHTHFFAIKLRVLDSFITPDEFSSYFAQDDLRQVWEGHDSLRVREDSVARARCGADAIFRAERVLVHRISQEEDYSPVNERTLLSTLQLQHRISEVLSSRNIRCLTTRERNCFVLSPLAFWNYDGGAVLSDQNLADTLSHSRNVSLFGITITPEMVLARREDTSSSARSPVDSATFLALTYFFPDTDCSNNAGHFAWLHALEEATESVGDLITQAQVPRLVALEVIQSPRVFL